MFILFSQENSGGANEEVFILLDVLQNMQRIGWNT